MARPHDIWEFGWTHPYEDRHEYIQSLPENEQEWATMLFHYIDYAFQSEVFQRTRRINQGSLAGTEYSDRVEQIRQEVKDRLEPPTDDRWKSRFQMGGMERFYGEKENE